MTVITFKPRQAAEQLKAKKSIRARLELEQLPVARGSQFSVDGGVRGRLFIGQHTIEALDGSLLGMAAFVANVGSVEVHAPSLSGVVVVLTGSSREVPPEVRSLEYAGKGMKAERQRAEYWFLKRLHVVLRVARNSKREQLGLLEGWERDMMADATSLLPDELRVCTRFKRAPGYTEDGSPLTAKGIEQAARNHRVLDAFLADKVANRIDIPWDHILRSENPHGPVAINGPAYIAVQRMLRKWLFPRMPKSYAELWTSFEFCQDLEMLLVAPFGGSVGSQSVKSHCSARGKTYPETSALFETCLAGDAGSIDAIQRQRDWLAALSAEFVEVTTEDSDEQQLGDDTR